MTAAARLILPELLDELAPGDPRARRARRDLRRVHRAMGTLSILRRAVSHLRLARPPRRILELGGGDGSLLLRLARAMRPQWSDVELTILDRHDLADSETLSGYAAVGWKVRVLPQDVLEWAAMGEATTFDLCTTCLFLHHFESSVLACVMRAIASKGSAFVACEPRRSPLARLGGALVGLLGASAITRGDAIKSVNAGFSNHELTALWPRTEVAWSCEEYAAFPFTHCFTAVRDGARRE